MGILAWDKKARFGLKEAKIKKAAKGLGRFLMVRIIYLVTTFAFTSATVISAIWIANARMTDVIYLKV